MSLFGRRSEQDLRDAADALSVLFEAKVQDAGGGIRVGDLLSAAAAVCGEACIAAVGEYDPEHHDFTPGAPILSISINEILCDDAPDWSAAGTSVFGLVRSGALAQGYVADDFPPIDEPIRVFVTGIGGRGGGAGGNGAAAQTGWGFVPLSIPVEHRPFIQPIRQAYELRGPVRAIFAKHRMPAAQWPVACAYALVIELARVRQAIDHGVAVRIVLETVNGMAKTAPMTERHFREAVGGS